MHPLPPALGQAFQDADQQAINAWWAALPESEQQDLTRLCDDKLDKCFFGVISGDRQHIFPKVIGGKFIPKEVDAFGLQEWGPDHMQHILDHADIYLIWDEPQRTFHSGCTSHPAARNCWSTGHIPASFACPFKHEKCLMSPFKSLTIKRLS